MASVLVEYVLLDRAGERERNPSILRALVGHPQTLPEILDEPVLTNGAPNWGREQGVIIDRGFARVTVLTGAVRYAWGGQRPDPTNGLELVAGDTPALLEMKTSDVIAFVQATTGRAAGAARADLQQDGNNKLSAIAAAFAADQGIKIRPTSAYPAQAAPITGVFAADSQSLPFAAEPGRPINVRISSAEPWTATIRLLRKLPGETEYRPLTMVGSPWGVFTGAVNEPVWEESEVGALFVLSCDHTAGAIDYRISQ